MCIRDRSIGHHAASVLQRSGVHIRIQVTKTDVNENGDSSNAAYTPPGGKEIEAALPFTLDVGEGQAGTWFINDDPYDRSITVTCTVGGANVDDNTSDTTVSRDNKSTGQSGAIAFGNASNSAQNFVTGTQTQNRLFGNDGGNDGQANFNDNSQLALAFGESIKRPNSSAIAQSGNTVWHSKDITNQMRKQHIAGLREKEQRAKQGLGVQGVDNEIPSSLSADTPFDVWMSGGYTKVDSSRTGNNFDGDLWFGRSGFDYKVSSNFLIGAFGGYDKGKADFESFNIDLESNGYVAGSYFGLKLTPSQTGLPVNLVLSGQGSHTWLDYDLKNNSATTTGNYDAGRFAGSINLTAVFLKPTAYGNTQILPKLGFNYVRERQDSYTDSGGNSVSDQTITVGQLTFGSSIVTPISKNVEIIGRAEGQWDFNDGGVITTTTGGTYKLDEFGIVLGGGVRASLDESTTFKLEAASEGIGRSNYDQYTVEGRLDFKF